MLHSKMSNQSQICRGLFKCMHGTGGGCGISYTLFLEQFQKTYEVNL